MIKNHVFCVNLLLMFKLNKYFDMHYTPTTTYSTTNIKISSETNLNLKLSDYSSNESQKSTLTPHKMYDQNTVSINKKPVAYDEKNAFGNFQNYPPYDPKSNNYEIHKHIVDVPVDIVRHNPQVETRFVEKLVELPGEVVEVPRLVPYQKIVPVPRYVDCEVPVIVAQTIKPVIEFSDQIVEVDVTHYHPKVEYVEVQIPKMIKTPFLAGGLKNESCNKVAVPIAQYNALLKQLNPHIVEEKQMNLLPFIPDENGSVCLLENMTVLSEIASNPISMP